MKKESRRTYKDLNRECKSLSLNPDKFGDYPLTVSVPIDCLNMEFDFGEIPDFPFECLEQVLLIGQTLHNIISQKVPSKTWNLSKEKDIIDRKRNLLVEEIVCEWEPIMKEWLNEGLKKAKSKKKLKISNGQVFEVAKSEIERMQRMDNYMSEVHLDYQNKEAGSIVSASKVILNAQS